MVDSDDYYYSSDEQDISKYKLKADANKPGTPTPPPKKKKAARRKKRKPKGPQQTNLEAGFKKQRHMAAADDMERKRKATTSDSSDEEEFCDPDYDLPLSNLAKTQPKPTVVKAPSPAKKAPLVYKGVVLDDEFWASPEGKVFEAKLLESDTESDLELEEMLESAERTVNQWKNKRADRENMEQHSS